VGPGDGEGGKGAYVGIVLPLLSPLLVKSENKLGRCLFGRGRVLNLFNGGPHTDSYSYVGSSAGVNEASDGEGMYASSVIKLDARDVVAMRNSGWTLAVKFTGKLSL
jgi:hypothetical protein